MSTKNVNTNLIFENLSTINNLCASLKAVCDNAAKEIEKISKAGSELKSYDGTLANKSERQNGDVITVYEARWDVNVSDTIINMSSNFNTTNVISSIDNLVTELNENEAIVEFIEQEINNLITELSNDETLRDEYNNSFNSLRESIALDGKSAVNDKFVKISDDYVQYWTDEPLRFEYNPKTGAYLIFQGSVAMGWTNKEGLMNYYNSLKKLTEEEIIQPVEYNEDGEEIIQPENYNGEDDIIQPVEYNEDGEEIIQPEDYNGEDEKTQADLFQTLETTGSLTGVPIEVKDNNHLQTLIDSNQSIFVPENMILCDKNGDPLGLNPMDGNGFFMYSTEYNPDGEYIYYVNDGKTGIAFSKEEMSNTKLMVNMGKK